MQPISNSVLRMPEVMKATGLSRTQIYRLEAAGNFPARVRLTAATSGWYQSEVEGWLKDRPRANPTTGAQGV